MFAGSASTTGVGDGQITAGNFGTIDIGSSDNSGETLVRQILNGPNASDFEHHGGSLKLIDDSGNKLVVNGDTGITASAEVSAAQALSSTLGEPRTILLYDTVLGEGNTTDFQIVAFVGIRVLDFQLTSGDKYIRIQPAPVIDDTVINGSIDESSYFVRASIRLFE